MMIDYLDRLHPEPRTSPIDPATNFVALLLEDYADEWLWRPAMHFRWSFDYSAELLSSWLAEHLPDPELSLKQKKAFWIERQRGIFVEGDGVTPETRAAVESIYQSTLSALEDILESRYFILGDRPTQADFGFMGPFFRHFFCDPDPGPLMRDNSPGVHEWVARMWNMKPRRFSSAAQIDMIPNDLDALLKPVASTYLPYLAANQDAIMAGEDQVRHAALGVSWAEPAKPYRLWCLDRLRQAYQALDDASRARVGDALDANVEAILSAAATGKLDNLVEPLPIPAKGSERPVLDSWGRKIEQT
jgi:glutathione S-transferase